MNPTSTPKSIAFHNIPKLHISYFGKIKLTSDSATPTKGPTGNPSNDVCPTVKHPLPYWNGQWMRVRRKEAVYASVAKVQKTI